jgi:hypothetical protein
VQYTTLQYSTVQYSAVQYSTLQYTTVQWSAAQYRDEKDKRKKVEIYGNKMTIEDKFNHMILRG